MHWHCIERNFHSIESFCNSCLWHFDYTQINILCFHLTDKHIHPGQVTYGSCANAVVVAATASFSNGMNLFKSETALGHWMCGAALSNRWRDRCIGFNLINCMPFHLRLASQALFRFQIRVEYIAYRFKINKTIKWCDSSREYAWKRNPKPSQIGTECCSVDGDDGVTAKPFKSIYSLWWLYNSISW